MNTTTFEIPKEAREKRDMAKLLRRRAAIIDRQADSLIEQKTRSFMRELKDKQLNRTECLSYLSIGTLESLKTWERKYSPFGYLLFTDNKIMRSDVLRFLDDLNSGKIHRKMNTPKAPKS